MRENRHLEYKENTNSNTFMKTISAYANYGTGILRINYAYEESIKKPTYKVFDNSIMIILPVFETKGKLTKTEQQLVQLLEENDEMSRKQIETEKQLGKATGKSNGNTAVK